MLEMQKIQQLMRKDLNLLLVFKTICQTGSVSKAADQLALSQPATSHALNRLRAAFDDPLFIRAKEGLVPTEFATGLIQPVSEVLDKLYQIFEQPHFDPKTSERRFRLAASDFSITALIPVLLKRFAQTAPLIAFDMRGSSKEAFAQLDNGQVELMLAVLPQPPKNYQFIELLQDHFVGVIHRSHPLAAKSKKQAVNLDEYLHYPHLSVSFTADQRDQTDEHLAELGYSRYIRAYLPNFVSGLASLAGSELIMTIPKQRGKAFLELFDLHEFELPMQLPQQSYYLIWHKRAEQDLGLQWLRAEIQAYFEQEADLQNFPKK